jgi:endonuclease-3
MTTSDPQRLRARQVVRRLARTYPDAHCALHYESPLQLLVATILSAQCTDARVNMVTPKLFARYPDAAAFATAKPRELQRLIHSTGFFRNKARNIIACCRRLVAQHGGSRR